LPPALTARVPKAARTAPQEDYFEHVIRNVD